MIQGQHELSGTMGWVFVRFFQHLGTRMDIREQWAIQTCNERSGRKSIYTCQEGYRHALSFPFLATKQSKGCRPESSQSTVT